jgi:hypothetical protein
MVSWWASHFGCHPVQQWKVSRLVAWCKLEVCGAFMMDWDIGRGCGRDALWVYWLGCMMGWPTSRWAARLESRWKAHRLDC